jgi:hypothetical protein
VVIQSSPPPSYGGGLGGGRPHSGYFQGKVHDLKAARI